MRRRILVFVASLFALGVVVPIATASPSSANPPVNVGYSCSNGRGIKARVSGAATIPAATPRKIHLTAVKFVVTNAIGPITVNQARFSVIDPPANAPYSGGAATAPAPPGWTGGHSVANGLNAHFTGPVAVPLGGTITNALLRGKYLVTGPTGAVVNFYAGPITLTLPPAMGGVVTCAVSNSPPPFATVTE